jgi:hypothetical protein
MESPTTKLAAAYLAAHRHAPATRAPRTRRPRRVPRLLASITTRALTPPHPQEDPPHAVSP